MADDEHRTERVSRAADARRSDHDPAFRSQREDAGTEPTHDVVDDELARALRRHVREIAERIPLSAGELHVLLELEVDGLRCVILVERPASSHRALSPRKHEIARMIAQGYPDKTIARAWESACGRYRRICVACSPSSASTPARRSWLACSRRSSSPTSVAFSRADQFYCATVVSPVRLRPRSRGGRALRRTISARIRRLRDSPSYSPSAFLVLAVPRGRWACVLFLDEHSSTRSGASVS